MKISLLCICSVPIRISSPQLAVLQTCFLLELHIMERNVTTKYHSHELHICAQSGYKTTTYL